MPTPIPLALPTPTPLHFLRYILSRTELPSSSESPQKHNGTDTKTILIVCSLRQTFLHDLASSSVDDPSSAPLLNSLVSTSLETLVVSTHVTLVFTPTIQHLRGYLASLPPQSFTARQQRIPQILAIWGLVEAHAETTEYSAQGIGRTVAAAVAAGVKTGRWVIVGGLQGSRGNGYG